jgi:hypothetical protein
MTLPSLEKFVSEGQQDQSADNLRLQQLIRKVKGKPFYIWLVYKNRNPEDSFNNIIGLPRKGGIEFPLFDYERQVYQALFNPAIFNHRPATEAEITNYRQRHSDLLVNLPGQKDANISTEEERLRKERIDNIIYTQKVKHVAVLKAAGLGISELALRIIAWLCMRNDDLKGSQIVIFTGPRLELAVSLIERLKDMFRPHGITFSDKETVCNLNGVRIEAFPSYHADSARISKKDKVVLQSLWVKERRRQTVIEESIKVTYHPWHAFVSLWKLITYFYPLLLSYYISKTYFKLIDIFTSIFCMM